MREIEWYAVLLDERGIVSKTYPCKETHHYDDPDIYWITREQLKKALDLCWSEPEEEWIHPRMVVIAPGKINPAGVEQAKDYIRQVGIQP